MRARRSLLWNLKIVTHILSFAVVEGAEDDQDADHHKYEGWKTPPIYSGEDSVEGTKARLKPVVCVGEVARLWHYRLDPIVHREAEGWRFLI